jgi:hypothetical protein
VEDLLGFLADLSQHDPSPAVRAHLCDLFSQRFQQKNVFGDTQLRKFAWLRAAFAAALLAVLGLAASWVIHLRQSLPKDMRSGNKPTGPSLPMPSVEETQAVPAEYSTMPPSTVNRRSRPKLAQGPAPSGREMVIQLPYSNSSVDTGTGATIQVSMSQSELLSLGFPLNAMLQDGRVVAELTLGDDGLPRAISLPLPLELIKEEK